LGALKRETRVGLAALISFGILVFVLVFMHGRGTPKADPAKDKKGNAVASTKGQTSSPEKKPQPRKTPSESLASRTPGRTLSIGGGGPASSESPPEAPAAIVPPNPGASPPAETAQADKQQISPPAPEKSTAGSGESVAENENLVPPEPPNNGTSTTGSESPPAAEPATGTANGGLLTDKPGTESPPTAPVADAQSNREDSSGPPALVTAPRTSAEPVASTKEGTSVPPKNESIRADASPPRSNAAAAPPLTPTPDSGPANAIETTGPASTDVPSSPTAASSSEPNATTAGLVPLRNAEKPLSSDGALRASTRAVGAMAPERASRTAEAADAPVDPILHVVQRGENFWTISRLYYGSGRFYRALWKANADQVPAADQLYVGTSVRVPPPEALDRSLIDAPKSVRSQARPASAPTSTLEMRPRTKAREASASPTSDLVHLPVGTPSTRPERDSANDGTRPRRYHVVREHETLRSVARDALGDSRRDGDIRDLNLRLLGDSDDLVPGMRLALPDDVSTIRR
jgi:nucleoid-associated protein YgaU